MKASLLNGSTNISSLFVCQERFKFTLFWTVLCTIFVLAGLPITLLLLKELIRKARENVSNELFMINLAIINLAYIFLAPCSVVDSIVWHYGSFECINSIMDAFILCATPLFLVCICVDCYVAVVRPVDYRSNKKIIIRKAACIIVWLSTICFITHKCFEIFAYPLHLNSGPLIFSLPVISFCDIGMLQALRKTDPARNSIHPQKKRALYTIFNSLVLTVIVYIPCIVIFLFADLFPMSREQYTCTVVVLGYSFSISGCIIMPVLHLRTMGKFNSLKDLLEKHFCTCFCTA